MQNLTIGLEHEAFITGNNNKLHSAYLEGLPYDGGLILLESRGKPYTDVHDAVFSLKADMDRLRSKVEIKGLNISDENWRKKDDEYLGVYDKALRRIKILDKSRDYHNLYNKLPSSKNKTHLSAGVHVSFKIEIKVTNKDGISVNVPKMFDFSRLIRSLDNVFENEIKKSERVPGFYEVKDDGRVEYRSLPQSVLSDKYFPNMLKRAIQEGTC